MIIKEAESFYLSDKKEYDVKNNSEFIEWMHNIVSNGYNQYLTLDDIDSLINNLVIWYELKYPNLFLDKGVSNYRFEKIKDISKEMTIEQLFYRLPNKQLAILDCFYRSNVGGWKDIYNKKGKVIGEKAVLGITISDKKEKLEYMVRALASNGKIYNLDGLEKYLDVQKGFNLNHLFLVLEDSFKEQFEISNLEKCLYNYECDLELREKILRFVSLKLLYSNTAIPEFGYIRAKKFIKQFNKKLNLDIKLDEINELMSNGYNDKEKILTK